MSATVKRMKVYAELVTVGKFQCLVITNFLNPGVCDVVPILTQFQVSDYSLVQNAEIMFKEIAEQSAHMLAKRIAQSIVESH